MSALANAVLQTCLNVGIRDFCLCAGSRNSDLVRILLRNQTKEALQLFSFFEERSAAFFALGRSRTCGKPVAVLTTSGTAAAELYPAAIEAHYQSSPLVLITADRPKRFRGSGAPQAIEQSHLLGQYAAFWDLDSTTDLDHFASKFSEKCLTGPTHLNVCLEEPTASEPEGRLSIPPREESSRSHSRSTPVPDVSALDRFLDSNEEPLLVIAGCLDTPSRALVTFLESLQCPIVADATSGLHAETALTPWLVKGGERTASRLSFQRVLRVGGVPSFRAWRDLELERSDVTVCSLSDRPFSGLARPSFLVSPIPIDALSLDHASQAAPPNWREIDAENRSLRDDLWRRYPRSEPAALARFTAQIPGDALIYVGNSLPIRELAMATESLPPRVYANRGANGIDGNLSSFLGLASGAHEQTAWGLFGDLTTLYELSAPSILSQLQHQQLRFVVINNGGGKIFGQLPNFQSISDKDKAIVENHHDFSFAHWAHAWGLEHSTFEEQLPRLGPHGLIEIHPDARETEAFWSAWRQR